MPPEWASLPEDRQIYLRPVVGAIPDTIRLTEDARCSCGAAGSNTDRTSFQDCVVYTLTHAVKAAIELQICHQCSSGRRRWVGPEGRDLGIFNWNNRSLFTHELLDDYTAAYTSSETPFVAWVNNVSRRYSGRGSVFVTEEMFRAAWFGYSRLQVWENDLTCPQCGPTPEDIIWDGVSSGFSRKHLLPSLKPPTSAHPDSPSSNARYIKGQTLLVEAKLRKSVRQVIEGPSSTKGARKSRGAKSPKKGDKTRSQLSYGAEDGESGEDDNDSEETVEEKAEKAEKARKELEIHLERIPTVVGLLQDIDGALGELFEKNFGVAVVREGVAPPGVYVRLFRQVKAVW